MGRLPAILGGKPIFSSRVPVSSATLPDFEAVSPRYREIFSSGMITNGKYVQELESKTAAFLRVRHAVAVSSNTSGLLLVLKCLGLTGEVILPSFTFSITGHVLWWTRLTPVYVDVDPENFLIDPGTIEAAITPKTCAIFGVHIWGNPCAAERLEEIANRRGLTVIFDAAQAFGSRYKDKPVGGFGRVEVFSCSPTKVMTSGEGGIVATNDEELARKIRIGRNYGDDGSYDCLFEGVNARMSELHAILGMASLEQVEAHIAWRLHLVDLYKKRLSQLPGICFQSITPGGVSNGVYFSILVDPSQFGLTRDHLYDALKAENIESRKYYFPPLHLQKVNFPLATRYKGRLPVTERIAFNSLTLPMFSHMTEEQVQGVCDAIERLYEHRHDLAKQNALINNVAQT